METRVVSTLRWTDSAWRKLSCGAKVLADYLISNPTLGHCPIYKLSLDDILIQTRILETELQGVIAEIEKVGMFHMEIESEDYWIIDCEYAVFGYRGPKNDAALAKEIARLPQALQERLLQMKKLSRIWPDRDVAHLVSLPLSPRPVVAKPTADAATEQKVDKEVPDYKTISYLDDMTDEVAQYYADKYHFPIERVKLEAERCANDVRSKGKKRTNYKATFANWLTAPWMKADSVRVNSRAQGQTPELTFDNPEELDNPSGDEEVARWLSEL